MNKPVLGVGLKCVYCLQLPLINLMLIQYPPLQWRLLKYIWFDLTMGLSLINLNFNSRFSIYFILTCTRPVDIKHGQIITSIRCSTVLFSAFRVLKDFEDFFLKFICLNFRIFVRLWSNSRRKGGKRVLCGTSISQSPLRCIFRPIPIKARRGPTRSDLTYLT